MARIILKCLLLTIFYVVRAHVRNGNELLIDDCRNACKSEFGYDQDDSACFSDNYSDCSMCWDMCELLVVEPFSWSPLCESEQASLCTAGCRKACQALFHSAEDDPSTKMIQSTTEAQEQNNISFDIVQESVDGVLDVKVHTNNHGTILRENVRLAVKHMDAFVQLNYQMTVNINSLPANLPSLKYNSQYYIEIQHESLGVIEQLVFSTLSCDVTDYTNTICQTIERPKVRQLDSASSKITFREIIPTYSSAVTFGLVICMTLLVLLCVRHCQHIKRKQIWTRTLSVESPENLSDLASDADISPIEYV